MNLSIERNALNDGLQRISRAVSPSGVIPILSHILIQAAPGELRLAATNMDIDIRAGIPADVKTPGSCTVSGDRFSSIVASLAAGAQVWLDLAETKLTVKSGRARFSLMTLSPEDFPDIRITQQTHSFSMPAKDIVGMIGAVEVCAETNDKVHFTLCGIFLHTAGSMLRMVTTDGNRLASVECPAPDGSIGMPGIIVPRKTASGIKRLAEKSQGDVKLSFDASKIAVLFSDGSILTSRLVDGHFPDYPRVIPLHNDKIVTVDREGLIAAVTRVSMMASDLRGGVKLEIADDRIIISMRNPYAGESMDEVECDYSGEPIEIGYRPQYVTEMLGVMQSDRVVMKLQDAASPTVIQEHDGAALLMVLMSIRV